MTRTHNILFLRGLGLFLVALLSLQCSPDSEGEPPPWNCPIEELQAGRYSFTLDKLTDGCAGGLLDEYVLTGSYDPVNLPDFQDLPFQTVMELPLAGSEPVLLAVRGDEIGIGLVEQGQVVLNVQGCELAFHFDGTLCPATESEIDVDIILTLLSATGACESLQLDEGCTLEGASKCRRCS